MKVVLHPAAVADLSAAGDWYERQRPGLGVDLIEEIERALEVIAESPTAWPRWPGAPTDLEIRRVLLPRFPFALPYLIQPDRIVVLAVAHEKRRPGYWLARAKRPKR